MRNEIRLKYFNRYKTELTAELIEAQSKLNRSKYVGSDLLNVQNDLAQLLKDFPASDRFGNADFDDRFENIIERDKIVHEALLFDSAALIKQIVDIESELDDITSYIYQLENH